MRTTTYRAPDKSRGYTGGEIAAILDRHHPAATVIARVGWKGQVQQLIISEPDVIELTAEEAARVEQIIARADDYEAGCKLPPPRPKHLGEPGARGMVTFPGPINVVPSPPSTEAIRDELTLDAIARATEAEELVREELRAEGIDVAAVERAARRAHDRGLGGAR